jgi:hypothetical protein
MSEFFAGDTGANLLSPRQFRKLSIFSLSRARTLKPANTKRIGHLGAISVDSFCGGLF